MELDEYLRSKRIDPEGFRAAEPARYQEWAALWADTHPNSFTSQKLFLINQIRRQYHYTPLRAEASDKVADTSIRLAPSRQQSAQSVE